MNEHRVFIDLTSQNYFFMMLPIIRELERQKIAFDVFTPKPDDPASYPLEHENLAVHIESKGIPVLRRIPKNMEYDVAYSAYPDYFYELFQQNQIKYHVKFAYGHGGANKPLLFCNQAIYNFYDFVLTFGEPDTAIYSGHIMAIPIGNIKLADYRRSRSVPNGKKTVLYLPTYNAWGNAFSSINIDTINKLLKLQNKYNLATKMHIGTTYLDEEKTHRELLGQFNNIYDARTPIADILNDVDIVLSDLSSAAFDAIAGDVPLALFGLGGQVCYGGKLCLHQQLVKDDIVPGTNNIDELENIIEKALTQEYFAKQQKLKKEMFVYNGKECLDAFMHFQKRLFEDHVNPWYIATRKALRENYIKEQKEIQNKFNEMTQVIEERQRAALEWQRAAEEIKRSYENSNSWKLTKPLRAIARLIRGR
jgi:CDP-glycerol glycerophosphotransferase (TagB/SpsB family)